MPWIITSFVLHR